MQVLLLRLDVTQKGNFFALKENALPTMTNIIAEVTIIFNFFILEIKVFKIPAYV
jgi:hypothetical protein